MTHKFAKIFDVKHQNKDFQVLFFKEFDDEEESYQIQAITYFLGASLRLNVGVETEVTRNEIFDSLNVNSAIQVLNQFENMGVDFSKDADDE